MNIIKITHFIKNKIQLKSSQQYEALFNEL